MSDDTIPTLLRRQATHLTLKPFMQVWQPGEGVVLTLSFAEMLRRVEAADERFGTGELPLEATILIPEAMCG